MKIKSKIIPDTLYVEIFPGNTTCSIVKNMKQNKKVWANVNGVSGYHDVEYEKFQNIPQTGLQLRGTVMEVHDPRGFTVSIPSYRVGDFVEGKTIIDGELIGEFVYGYEGNKLNIIEYNSDMYNEYEKGEIKSISKVSKIKEFDVGGVYENGHGDEYTYLGLFTVTSMPSISYKTTEGNNINSNALLKSRDTYIKNYNLKDTYISNRFLIAKNHCFMKDGNFIFSSMKMYIKKYTNPLFSDIEKNKEYMLSKPNSMIFSYYYTDGNNVRFEDDNLIQKNSYEECSNYSYMPKYLIIDKEKLNELKITHPDMLVYAFDADSTTTTKIFGKGKTCYNVTYNAKPTGAIKAEEYTDDTNNVRKIDSDLNCSVRKHVKIENIMYCISVLMVDNKQNLVMYPNGKFTL